MGYYGFLATQVPPRRLLAAAARRAVRAARIRLAPPTAPSTAELLEALSCNGPGEVGAALAAGLPRAAWTPAQLRRTLPRALPGSLARIAARAEDAAAGRLLVYGRRIDARRPDGGTDWQRDALNGGRFDGRAPSGALPPAPGLDPKAAWALARGEQWVALACAAALGGPDAGSPDGALAASVADFEAENPLGRGVHWASAMEVALRAWNLALALWLRSPRGLPGPALALPASRLLVASGRFVLAHLEDDTAVPNNHLVTDWLGLLACAAALPRWPEAARWRALACAGLRAAIDDQVHADGTSFEGSVPYHRYSLELFLAGLLLAHAAGAGLGRAYAARLRAMLAATRALLAASGELPLLGDNDSGHALAVRERGPTEGGYLLPLGAALTHDPALLVRPGTADADEVAWLLGPGALAWLERARPGPPPGSAAFPSGGFHALRRGAIEAFVSCGRNGQRGIGGHSHNDKLALELFVAGVRAVCDPGTPVYGRDPALRDAFRATRAHATVAVDGLEQAPIPPGRIFALPEAAGARLIGLARGADADQLAGEHRGYARAGIVHRRRLWAAPEGLVAVDRLLGRGRHAVELRWPLASIRAAVRPATAAEADALARLARTAGRGRLRGPLDLCGVVEVSLGAAGRLLLALSGPTGLALELAPAVRAPGYAERVEGTVALAAGTVRCPATLATVILHLPGPPR